MKALFIGFKANLSSIFHRFEELIILAPTSKLKHKHTHYETD